MQLVTGKCATHAIRAAVELGLPDALARGPRPSAELANELSAHPTALVRLCRALCLFGVLAETDPGVFTLTPVGDGLRADAPGSIAGLARLFGSSWHDEIWADLTTSVRTGASSFLARHPEGFGWFAANPEAGLVFDQAMTSLSKAASFPVLDAYPFTGARRICDVGGGHGHLLASILGAVPEASGVLYELPRNPEATRALFAAAGVGERAELVTGDFFEGVPAGFDHYVLKHVIHDWDDDACVGILERCAAGLTAGGKVVIIEQVLPPVGASPANVIDLEMLLMTPGGRERNAEELGGLLARAGLALDRLLPTKSPLSVLVASKA
jgi:hypothetical protein